MATISIPDELLQAIDKEVRDGGYDSDAEYLARLVRQDQKRRAKEELEILFSGGRNAQPQ